MSGPKSAGWSVYHNLEREKRIVEELHDQVRVLNVQLQEIANRWAEAEQQHGYDFQKLAHSSFELPAGTATQNELQEIVRLMLRKVSRLQAEYEQEISLAAMRHMFSEITTAPFSSDTGNSAKNSTNGYQYVDAKNRELRIAEVSTMFKSLLPSVPSSERERIVEFANEMVNGINTNRFDTLKIEAYLQIQRVNEKASAIERDSMKAIDLRCRLVGVDGEEVRHLDHELKQVERRELPLRDNLIEEFEAVVNHATQASDRLYASHVILDELKNLGYLVETGFETIFVEGGELQLRKAELAEYRVVLNTKPELEQIEVHLARQASSEPRGTQEQRLRDSYMEDAWCKDLAKVFSASGERGINGRIVERISAGMKAVPVIEEKSVSQRGRQSSSSLHHRSRLLDP